MENYKYLITTALPYANGPIHLGHLLEQIQANIFVRYLKMSNIKTLYICGADSHGSPIELNAKKQNKSPEILSKIWQKEHKQSLALFNIKFDGDYLRTNIKKQ